MMIKRVIRCPIRRARFLVFFFNSSNLSRVLVCIFWLVLVIKNLKLNKWFHAECHIPREYRVVVVAVVVVVVVSQRSWSLRLRRLGAKGLALIPIAMALRRSSVFGLFFLFFVVIVGFFVSSASFFSPTASSPS